MDFEQNVYNEEIQKLFGIDIAKECLEQVLYTCIEKDVDSVWWNAIIKCVWN